jgi:RecB family exonuclease
MLPQTYLATMLTTFSYSSLNSFRQCPLQFKFRYVERKKVPSRLQPDTFVGAAVHLILKKLYQHGADGVVIPLDDAVAAYRAEWNKIDPNSIQLRNDYYTVDDYIRLGERMLVKHHERYRPFDEGTLLLVERMLSFELPDSPFKVRGRIDKAVKRDDGVVEVCDYKTGLSIAQPQDDAFRWQMGIYHLAVRAAYPQLEQIEVTQHFLRQDEKVRYCMQPDELAVLTDELRTVALESHQATRLDNFPPHEGGHCNYCDYVDYCPAKRHRLMLEAEEETTDTLSEGERLRQLADRVLDVYEQYKKLGSEYDALKEELRQIVRDGGPSRLDGQRGSVSIRMKRREKFLTKTADPAAFAELNRAVRELGLDEYLMVDGGALMKEIFAKKRLPEEQLEKLRPFVVEKEEAAVLPRLHTGADDDD